MCEASSYRPRRRPRPIYALFRVQGLWQLMRLSQMTPPAPPPPSLAPPPPSPPSPDVPAPFAPASPTLAVCGSTAQRQEAVARASEECKGPGRVPYARSGPYLADIHIVPVIDLGRIPTFVGAEDHFYMRFEKVANVICAGTNHCALAAILDLAPVARFEGLVRRVVGQISRHKASR